MNAKLYKLSSVHSKDTSSNNHNHLNRETCFSFPPQVTLDETIGCFVACYRKVQWSRGLLLCNIRKPGSNLESGQQWFYCRLNSKGNVVVAPELSEIEAWFETKTKEFTKIENRNPNHDSEAWLQKYIYTNVHEVFFATFPSELYSWLVRLADCSGYVRSDRPE